MSDVDVVIHDVLAVLRAIRSELAIIKGVNVEMCKFMREAEKEIPESYRRFLNAFHDMHDVKFIYEEHGQAPPPHVLEELERLDDRCRQIVKEHRKEGGAINKILREMAGDPENRWDHTRLLPTPPKENGSETGQSE